jgi:hypothetical protein
VGKLTAYANEQTDETTEDGDEKASSISVDDLVEAILGGVARASNARERTATSGSGNGLPKPRPWPPDWPWTIVVGFWDPPTGSGPWEGGGQDPGGDDPIPF